MSVIDRIRTFFEFGNDDEASNGLEELQNALRDREHTLSLTAEYLEPSIDPQGEMTAMFQTAVYNDGELYGVHSKEFPIPDNGLNDESAPLTQFLADHGIESVEDLGEIEGDTANAVLKDNGEIEVEE